MTAWQIWGDSPRDAPRLHVVGQCDVIAPDVELPLAQAQNTAKNVACVYADPHVHIEACCFTNKPERRKPIMKWLHG
jgi:hypothetical protein